MVDMHLTHSLCELVYTWKFIIITPQSLHYVWEAAGVEARSESWQMVSTLRYQELTFYSIPCDG